MFAPEEHFIDCPGRGGLTSLPFIY